MKPLALVVTRNLPPLTGGMERLLWHVIDELCKEYDVIVVGPSGCAQMLPEGVQAREISVKPLPIFLVLSLIYSVYLSIRYHPVFVFAGSGLTAPMAWLAARVSLRPCVAYLHGLDIKVNHRLYQIVWLPFIRRMDRIIVNSGYTKNLAEEQLVESAKIEILNPGVELPEMVDCLERAATFRTNYGLQSAPIMLHVGRIVERKGIAGFLENILPDILAHIPGAQLVIVGDDASDALVKSGSEKQKLNGIIRARGLDGNVVFTGRCSDSELSSAYFAADVLIFPLQPSQTDIEGFGMVAVEAAAHGTPVVAFAVGGVTDAVAEEGCGGLVKPGDTKTFSGKVIELLQSSQQDTGANQCRGFAEKYEWRKFGVKLLSICRALRKGH